MTDRLKAAIKTAKQSGQGEAATLAEYFDDAFDSGIELSDKMVNSICAEFICWANLFRLPDKMYYWIRVPVCGIREYGVHADSLEHAKELILEGEGHLAV